MYKYHCLWSSRVSAFQASALLENDFLDSDNLIKNIFCNYFSSLALRQQAEVRRLLEQQEKDREELKKMFEEQQKKLVEEILQQVKSSQQSRLIYNLS